MFNLLPLLIQSVHLQVALNSSTRRLHQVIQLIIQLPIMVKILPSLELQTASRLPKKCMVTSLSWELQSQRLNTTMSPKTPTTTSTQPLIKISPILMLILITLKVKELTNGSLKIFKLKLTKEMTQFVDPEDVINTSTRRLQEVIQLTTLLLIMVKILSSLELLIASRLLKRCMVTNLSWELLNLKPNITTLLRTLITISILLLMPILLTLNLIQVMLKDKELINGSLKMSKLKLMKEMIQFAAQVDATNTNTRRLHWDTQLITQLPTTVKILSSLELLTALRLPKKCTVINL